MPKDAELYRRLDEVAHYIWDPIGISNVPDARDEYRAYLRDVLPTLMLSIERGLLQSSDLRVL